MTPQSHKPAIKAVLFDLDDTLWPLAPVLAKAEDQVFAWLAQHAPKVTQRYTIESMREQRNALLLAQPHLHINMLNLRQLAMIEVFQQCGEDIGKVDAAISLFADARNAVTAFPDVVPALHRLGKKLALGTITNGTADLAIIGLAQHFQFSLAAYQFGHAKPAIGIFHSACEAMGITPHEAVYVGDDLLLDVEAAQQAGMRAVWMNRGLSASVETLHPHVIPDAVCADLVELEQILDQWQCDGA